MEKTLAWIDYLIKRTPETQIITLGKLFYHRGKVLARLSSSMHPQPNNINPLTTIIWSSHEDVIPLVPGWIKMQNESKDKKDLDEGQSTGLNVLAEGLSGYNQSNARKKLEMNSNAASAIFSPASS